MITKFGKRFLASCAAGVSSFNRQDIAIGSATGVDYSLSDNNSRLGFEFYRLPVVFGGLDIQTVTASITAASWSSNLITFTANNTFSSGQSVTISGSSNSSYNITGSVFNPTASTFQLLSTSNPGTFTGTATATVSSYSVVYKTTVPQDVAGIVNEIGLYPSNRTSLNNYDSRFIADFEDNLLWKDSSNNVPSLVLPPTTYPRIGVGAVLINCGAGISKEFKSSVSSLDISGYSGNDTLSILINQVDLNLDYINIRFYSSSTAYYQVSFDGTDIDTGTGNKLLSRNLSTMTSVNNPGSLITSISVTVAAKVGGATNLYLDGLRINDEDTFDPTFGLVARSTITTSTTISGSSGANTITVGSSSNLFVGQSLIGTGIAANAVITQISGTTVTLSVNNTGTVSGNGTFYGIKKIAGTPLDLEYKLGLNF